MLPNTFFFILWSCFKDRLSRRMDAACTYSSDSVMLVFFSPLWNSVVLVFRVNYNKWFDKLGENTGKHNHWVVDRN